MSYNLHEFSNMPDEQLLEGQLIENGATGKDFNPAADMFNSAGNTKFAGDEEEETKEPTQTEQTPIRGKIVLGKLISGKATVNLVNIFIPSFIVFSLHKLGYDGNKGQFKLTGEEKEILNPVVQDCLNYIEINFDNPFYALAFVATMIYGAKIMDVVPELKKYKEDAEKTIDEIEDLDNNKEYTEIEETKPVVKRQYFEIRKRIDSTSIRSEKNKIIIETIEKESPKDLIEMWQIYGGIFPERMENYFRDWYGKQYEKFPEHLKFGDDKKDEEFTI